MKRADELVTRRARIIEAQQHAESDLTAAVAEREAALEQFGQVEAESAISGKQSSVPGQLLQRIATARLTVDAVEARHRGLTSALLASDDEVIELSTSLPAARREFAQTLLQDLEGELREAIKPVLEKYQQAAAIVRGLQFGPSLEDLSFPSPCRAALPLGRVSDKTVTLDASLRSIGDVENAIRAAAEPILQERKEQREAEQAAERRRFLGQPQVSMSAPGIPYPDPEPPVYVGAPYQEFPVQ